MPTTPDNGRFVQAATAQDALRQQEHVSRNLERYARSKGKQHAEVDVTRALEGGAFNWRWSQTAEEVTLWVDVPKGTRPKAVACEINRQHLALRVSGVAGTMEVSTRSASIGEAYAHRLPHRGSCLVRLLRKACGLSVRALCPDCVCRTTGSLVRACSGVCCCAVDRECVQIELMKRKATTWPQVFQATDIGAVPKADVEDYDAVADRIRIARASGGSTHDSDIVDEDGLAWHRLTCVLRIEGGTVVAPKEEMSIKFTVTPHGDTQPTDVDYIGIFGASVTDASDHDDVEFTDGALTGRIVMRAPRVPGEYKLAYLFKQELRAPLMVQTTLPFSVCRTVEAVDADNVTGTAAGAKAPLAVPLAGEATFLLERYVWARVAPLDLLCSTVWPNHTKCRR